MEYLTVKEAGKQWGITARMVNYYCSAGRISAAVKKGNLWMIPASAEKPVDRRYSKAKMQLENGIKPQSKTLQVSKNSSDNFAEVYHSSDIYKNLGLTRETLRYYEEIGLIEPQRNKDSQYREFTFFDASHLMAIDFYKKRGFTPLEIRQLMQQKSAADSLPALAEKISATKENILQQQLLLKRLEETEHFYQHFHSEKGLFSIREMPLYAVSESFDAISSLKEYQENIIQFLNLESEDILSNMVRVLAFDKAGYKGSAICLVQQPTKVAQDEETVYLESGKCAYTVIDADSQDDSLLEKMFDYSHKWAAQQQVSFKGFAYIFIRFVGLEDKREHNYYEIWLPLK